MPGAALPGRRPFQATRHGTRSLAAEVAGLGATLELLAPPELRDHLAAVGAELAALYGARR